MLRFAHLILGLSLVLFACQPAFLAQPASNTLRRQSVSQTPPSGGSLTGQFRLHAQVKSNYLKYQRDVLVWLPPGYEANPTRRYPVLYMHDGNNLFDTRTSFGGSEWQVDERTGELIRQGSIEPIIIVGIYNTAGRMEEYTWYNDELDGQTLGGEGANYARFLAEELKPMIDKTYRSLTGREHTGVMGSSLGGLISFYIGMQYPQIFGQIGMMSPSIWWKDRAILADVAKLSPDSKIWVDMGTQEGQRPEIMLQNTKDFVQALEKRGFQHFKNLAFHVENGAGHNEQAWSQRIHRPLQFFYGAH